MFSHRTVWVAAVLLVASHVHEAEAHGGMATSYGANPVFSVGGYLSATTSGTTDSGVLFTAPLDQDVVITDLVLSAQSDTIMSTYTGSYHRSSSATLTLSTSAGQLGQWQLSMTGYKGSFKEIHTDSPLCVSFASGLLVPAGEAVDFVSRLEMSPATGTDYMAYTISGFYVKP